jgi:hypothetical protein
MVRLGDLKAAVKQPFCIYNGAKTVKHKCVVVGYLLHTFSTVCRIFSDVISFTDG